MTVTPDNGYVIGLVAYYGLILFGFIVLCYFAMVGVMCLA